MTTKPEICGGLAQSVRMLARGGHSAEWIASRHALDPAAVRAFLDSPKAIDRLPRGTARQIRGPLVPRVLDLHGRGWSPRDIGYALDLDPAVIGELLNRYDPIAAESLAKPRTRREQEAAERRERERLERALRPPPWRDEWKDAAAVDPAYRDPVMPVCPVELPAIARAPELVNNLACDEVPRVEADTEPWGSIRQGGVRKISQAVLTESLKLHQAGESWPAIARRFGVCRNALFAARRRSLGRCEGRG